MRKIILFFGFYPFAAQLQRRLGVPVIDPLRAGIAAAQAMLTLDVLPSIRSIPRLADSQPLVEHLDTPSLASPDTMGLSWWPRSKTTT